MAVRVGRLVYHVASVVALCLAIGGGITILLAPYSSSIGTDVLLGGFMLFGGLLCFLAGLAFRYMYPSSSRR